MIETIITAAKEIGESILDNKFISNICPDFLKPEVNIADYQIEAAAKCAGDFFGMPDLKIEKGDSIAVMPMDVDVLGDEVLKYNIEQFKDLGLDTFEDQAKVWSHEMGHVILQKEYPVGGWADELGADFFVGVRSEILGIGSGKFERFLGKEPASLSHPNGKLRIDAVNYGREVVAQMKREGITPTWQNCIEKFKESDFAKYTAENQGDIRAFVNDASYHYRQAADAKRNAEYYKKEAERASKNGDFSRASDYASKAASYARKAEEESRAAEKCTK